MVAPNFITCRVGLLLLIIVQQYKRCPEFRGAPLRVLRMISERVLSSLEGKRFIHFTINPVAIELRHQIVPFYHFPLVGLMISPNTCAASGACGIPPGCILVDMALAWRALVSLAIWN